VSKGQPVGTHALMPVCQIALSATDLNRTVQWYSRTFNWRPAGERREREGEIWAKVPGLPEAHFAVWCMIERARFFQLELFEFYRPRMRLQRPDARPSDVGYACMGLETADLDAVLRRLDCTGGVLLGSPMVHQDQRRVCVRDPDGILIELTETKASEPGHTAEGPLATVSSITVSVHDLERAKYFWIEALGLRECIGSALHGPDEERLWDLEGARRRECVLDGGSMKIELVQYLSPKARNRPAGYLLSDQGILNIALGTTKRDDFNAVLRRATEAGFRTCHPPWSVPDVATVTYLQDDQGFTVELLCVEPQGLERMGFPPSGVNE